MSGDLVLPVELEMSFLRCFEESIRDAHEEHLRTGDYAPLGMAAQDALLVLDRDLASEGFENKEPPFPTCYDQPKEPQHGPAIQARGRTHRPNRKGTGKNNASAA